MKRPLFKASSIKPTPLQAVQRLKRRQQKQMAVHLERSECDAWHCPGVYVFSVGGA